MDIQRMDEKQTGERMGDVIAVFRIMPDAPDSFSRVKEQLEALGPRKVDEEPIAFGLKALKATFIIPDEGGRMDELENKLNAIDGTQAVETLQVSRSL
jgi:elongation factor 1-beta